MMTLIDWLVERNPSSFAFRVRNKNYSFFLNTKKEIGNMFSCIITFVHNFLAVITAIEN